MTGTGFYPVTNTTCEFRQIFEVVDYKFMYHILMLPNKLNMAIQMLKHGPTDHHYPLTCGSRLLFSSEISGTVISRMIPSPTAKSTHSLPLKTASLS